MFIKERKVYVRRCPFSGCTFESARYPVHLVQKHGVHCMDLAWGIEFFLRDHYKKNNKYLMNCTLKNEKSDWGRVYKLCTSNGVVRFLWHDSCDPNAEISDMSIIRKSSATHKSEAKVFTKATKKGALLKKAKITLLKKDSILTAKKKKQLALMKAFGKSRMYQFESDESSPGKRKRAKKVSSNDIKECSVFISKKDIDLALSWLNEGTLEAENETDFSVLNAETSVGDVEMKDLEVSEMRVKEEQAETQMNGDICDNDQIDNATSSSNTENSSLDSTDFETKLRNVGFHDMFPLSHKQVSDFVEVENLSADDSTLLRKALYYVYKRSNDNKEPNSFCTLDPECFGDTVIDQLLSALLRAGASNEFSTNCANVFEKFMSYISEVEK